MFVAVPTLPEARRQQAAGDVTETQEVQEQNHSGLQDTGHWSDQHGTGTGHSLTQWSLSHALATLSCTGHSLMH